MSWPGDPALNSAHNIAVEIESPAPTAFANLLTSCGVGVCVLSVDPALVKVVRRISGDHPSIVVTEEWPALLQAIDDGRCGIVLLDTDCVGDTLAQRLAELERRATPPVVVAASGRDDAPELMRALTERRIHRLLLKPASPGNARLLLEAAITRSLQLQGPGHEGTPVGGGPARRSTGWFRRQHGIALGVAMALVFGAVVVAGLARTKPDTPAAVATSDPVAAPAPALEPVAAEDSLAERLARADRAFDAGRLVDPPGDNALDGYAAILAEQPDHARAVAGLTATIDLLFTWAESALLGGVPELASATLDHVRRVQPENSRLAFLDTQLERARAAAAEAEAAAAEAARAASAPPVLPVSEAEMQASQGAALAEQARELLAARNPGPAGALIAEARGLGADAAVLAELEAGLAEVRDSLRSEREAGLLALGVERLREGRLVAPEADSAAHYLASLRAQAPASPGLVAPLRELTAALVENFEAAVAAGDWAEAESWLGGLRQIGADATFVGTLAEGLAVGRTQAEYLRTAVSAEALTAVRTRAPVYPDAALRGGIEGWVELEFIVDRDGQPRDIVVVGAQPAGAFDRSATHAVARYRYEPFAEHGVIYERRVRLRIRFALER